MEFMPTTPATSAENKSSYRVTYDNRGIRECYGNCDEDDVCYCNGYTIVDCHVEQNDAYFYINNEYFASFSLYDDYHFKPIDPDTELHPEISSNGIIKFTDLMSAFAEKYYDRIRTISIVNNILIDFSGTKLERIRSISIHKINAFDTSVLGDLSGLRCFILHIIECNISNISNLPNLRHIILIRTNINNMKSSFKNMVRLTDITILNDNLTTLDIKLFKNSIKLRSLSIRECKKLQEIIGDLSIFPDLEIIRIADSKIASLDILANLPKLNSLTFYNRFDEEYKILQQNVLIEFLRTNGTVLYSYSSNDCF